MRALFALAGLALAFAAGSVASETRTILSAANAVVLFDAVCGKDGPLISALPSALRAKGYAAVETDTRFQRAAVELRGDSRAIRAVSYRHPTLDAQFAVFPSIFDGKECALVFATASSPGKLIAEVRKIATRRTSTSNFFYGGDNQAIVEVGRLPRQNDRNYLQLSLIFFPKSKFLK